MKVKDLIEQLNSLDPELTVVRPGYEGGVTEVGHLSTIEVFLNVNKDWYYGEHEQVDEFSNGQYPNAERSTVVELV